MRAYKHILCNVCVTGQHLVLALLLERYDYVSISRADCVSDCWKSGITAWSASEGGSGWKGEGSRPAGSADGGRGRAGCGG